MGRLCFAFVASLVTLSVTNARADVLVNPVVGTGNYALLPNGGFEAGLTNWNIEAQYHPGDYVASQDISIAGSWVAKSVPGTSFSGYGFTRGQLYPFVGGQQYVISGYIDASRAAPSDNSYVDAFFSFVPGSQAVAVSGEPRLQFVYSTFTAPSTQSHWVRLVRDNNVDVGHYTYFDEIAVTPASQFVPPSGTPLVPPLTLSGAVAFSASSSGNANGGEVWNTQGGDSWFNLYVSESGRGGAFINSGNGAAASVSKTLSPGTHTLTVFGDYPVEGDLSHYGVNLFFNGNNSTPGISVIAARNTSPVGPRPSFSGNAGNTLQLNGSPTPGSGSLSFNSGGQTVKVVDFRWSGPSVHQLDRVSALNTAPSGAHDSIGELTVSVVSQAPRSRQPSPPPPMLAEISKRMGVWNGNDYVSVAPGDIQTNKHVYVITHGWGRGMKDEMQRDPNAKAWEVYSDSDLDNGVPKPNTKPWGAWMKDMAASIRQVDPNAEVLAFSWLDHSATGDGVYAGDSQRESVWAGYRLGNLLKTVLPTGSTNDLRLMGASHGARVASEAAVSLKESGKKVSRLTFFDSPENGFAKNWFVEGKNDLDRNVLKQLLATNSGQGIGNGEGQTFVENYYSIFGQESVTDGVVNVRLQGTAEANNDAPWVGYPKLHGYPYEWFTRSASADSEFGLRWDIGGAPIFPFWKQDWLRTITLPPDPTSPTNTRWVQDDTRELDLVMDVQEGATQETTRTPAMVIYNREGSVAGSTPQAMLRLDEGNVLAPQTNATEAGSLLSGESLAPTSVPGSPAFVDLLMTTQTGDSYLTFDYEFVSAGDGDELGIWINDELRFVINGFDAPVGMQSESIDI
ncbi:MAG: hypothetical protein QOF78_2561, partial [Phycisphaerales bacterium]|nr:hypothetical protein [Phycisphaerales bacterium]